MLGGHGAEALRMRAPHKATGTGSAVRLPKTALLLGHARRRERPLRAGGHQQKKQPQRELRKHHHQHRRAQQQLREHGLRAISATVRERGPSHAEGRPVHEMRPRARRLPYDGAVQLVEQTNPPATSPWIPADVAGREATLMQESVFQQSELRIAKTLRLRHAAREHLPTQTNPGLDRQHRPETSPVQFRGLLQPRDGGELFVHVSSGVDFEQNDAGERSGRRTAVDVLVQTPEAFEYRHCRPANSLPVSGGGRAKIVVGSLQSEPGFFEFERLRSVRVAAQTASSRARHAAATVKIVGSAAGFKFSFSKAGREVGQCRSRSSGLSVGLDE